jgi:hypothetical protein
MQMNFYSDQYTVAATFCIHTVFSSLHMKRVACPRKCKITRILLLLFAVSLQTNYAEVKIGKLGALAFGLDTTFYTSDNINMDRTANSDSVTSILPTINYRNQGGSFSVDAFFGQEVITYKSFSQNNSEDFKSKASVKYPNRKSGENFSLLLEGGINEYNLPISNVFGVGNIVSTTETDLMLDGQYYLNERVTLRGDMSYLDFASDSLTYADLKSLTVPISVKYDYDKSISTGLGYRYRTTRMGDELTSARAESDDQAIYLILDNERSSVWTYTLEVGLQKRDFVTKGTFTDINGLFASGTANWYISDRSNLKGEVSNEYGTTLANQSTETCELSLQLKHNINDRLRLIARMSYEEIEYDQAIGNREDECSKIFLSLDYVMLGGDWILSGMIGHTENNSSHTRANYDATYSSIRSIIVF